MLPSLHRMTDAAEFTSVVRDGRRVRTATVVLHHRSATSGCESAPASVGFVVSKAVGGSVVRHRVTRRLRAQLVDWVPTLPAGSGTVVRALPASARATSADLGADVRRAFAKLDRQR